MGSVLLRLLFFTPVLFTQIRPIDVGGVAVSRHRQLCFLDLKLRLRIFAICILYAKKTGIPTRLFSRLCFSRFLKFSFNGNRP